MNSIDFKCFPKRKRANFVNSLSGFKSANLVGTKNNQGQTNLALMSSAFHLGADPALLGLIIRPDSVPRDTLTNLRENGFATINHVHEGIYKQAHHTSARYPKEISEFTATGLNEEYLENFHAPFVKESYLRFSVKLVEEKKIEINNTHLLILEVLNVYMDENSILDDGEIDLHELNTITISSLNGYHNTDLLERLPYAKPKADLIGSERP